MNSVKRNSIIFLLCTLLLLVTGCSNQTPLSTSPVDEEGSEGFLWKVENKGNVVYLLGSIHVGNKDLYPLRPTILKAFDDAQHAYFEISFSPEEQAKISEKLLQISAYESGKSLKDDISPKLYELTTEKFAEFGVDPSKVARFKPWYIARQYLSSQTQQGGYIEGIDLYLFNKAVEDGKEIGELEGSVYHYNILNSFSPKLQEDFLYSTLESEEYLLYDDVLKSWIDGDKEKLSSLMFGTSFFHNEEFVEKILTQRDAAMATKIQTFLESDESSTYFIVVGAGHLIRDEGIIGLLKGMNYKVERL